MATATTNTPPRDVLIERAHDLVPALRERSAVADEIRRLPDENHRELADAELYKIYLPARYGGFEFDIMMQVDLAAELVGAAARPRGFMPSSPAIAGCTACSRPRPRTRFGTPSRTP